MFIPHEDRQDGVDLKRTRISAVLDGAIDLLRREGWVNYNPNKHGGGGTCLGYALAHASIQTVGGVTYHDVSEPVLTAAHIQTGQRWASIPLYNDAPGRTFADIEAVMQLAATIA